MKKILSSLVLGLMLVSTSACAKEETKTTPVVQSKVEESKPLESAKEEPKEKKVCVKLLDNKTNKEVEKCRVMKIHKKYEGTAVPEPAKK